jgi:hypothetical protein
LKPGAICIASSLLLIAGLAGAEEARLERRWEIDLSGRYVVIGGAVTTGGIMPQFAARHTWPISGWFDIHAGAQIGAFGFADEGRWLGILGGIQVGAYTRPTKIPLRFGLTFVADGGRIPVCNDWGLCIRFNGFYPAGVVEATIYEIPWKVTAMSASLSARRVNSLAWSGWSFEPTLGGRFYW